MQKQLDIQVARQQMSSTYYGIASGASLENVSEELGGLPVANQQVSSVGMRFCLIRPWIRIPWKALARNNDVLWSSTRYLKVMERYPAVTHLQMTPPRCTCQCCKTVSLKASPGLILMTLKLIRETPAVYLGIVGHFHLSAKHEM